LTNVPFYTKLKKNALQTLFQSRKNVMAFKRSSDMDETARERRSGMNRRWIKTPYHGVERRSGRDRRAESPSLEAAKTSESAAERAESLEKLVLSTTVRLEALARLLVEKGLLSHQELSEMLQTMQAEYDHQQIKQDG
jgi:hypothetical protein